MYSSSAFFLDNNLLWYEVKIWFTVVIPRVKNNLWELLFCNFEIANIS